MTLADTRGARPETVARLEAELVGLGMTRAETRAESRALIERARRDPPPVDLWRVNAAGARHVREPLRRRETLALLHSADVAAERDSIVATVVLGLMLIWNDDLETALAHADGAARGVPAAGLGERRRQLPMGARDGRAPRRPRGRGGRRRAAGATSSSSASRRRTRAPGR